MTNEELITICKGWRDRSIELTNKEIVDGAEDVEIYDAIIEALEQQPSEDCINRERLLARIDEERKHLLDLKMDGAEHIIVHHARRIIEDMPSVTPQPKRGKWIDGKCNRCGTHAPYWAMASTYYCSEYCPNCGSYNGGEEE